MGNEKISSDKTYSAKALGEDESTWSKYSDVSSAKYTGSYGLGHRGYSSANAVTKRPMPITFPTSDSVVLINGVPCSSSNVEIVANWCVPKSPHFDQEGDICANDGTSTEAYCSYQVGDDTCAYCKDPSKSDVPKEDDVGAEDREKYKRLIRKQLDEENEDETDEEMDANVKVVMQLSREAAAQKGKKTKSVKPVAGDGDAVIESKVIAALRKAGKA